MRVVILLIAFSLAQSVLTAASANPPFDRTKTTGEVAEAAEQGAGTEKITVAEVVWFEPAANKNHIFYASYDGEQWHELSTPLVTSERSLTTPVLTTLLDGQKFLIWSEQRPTQGMDLMIMASQPFIQPEQETDRTGGSEGLTQWSSPKILSSLGNYNLGASALVDTNGRVWVCWSADYYQSSDVFMIQQTESGWSSPQRIHEPNTLPDINVKLELSDKGEVEAIWKFLDAEQLSYVDKRKKFKLEDSTVAQSRLESPASDKFGLGDVSIPGFVPKNQRLIIHFPNNLQNQSISAR